MKNLVARTSPRSVALETTLLLHGVPAGEGAPLAKTLSNICRDHQADPAVVGVVHGVPTVGLTDQELQLLLDAPKVAKANTANLGVLLHAGKHAATTVSTTMELAAAAGIRYFATGGLGGVHLGYAAHLDISADLAAFTRYPVAVVTAGVKSILDVVATREALETLGVPVIGYQTDRFPAFYLRESDAKVDARFDNITDLAKYINFELSRTGRGVVIANPIPPAYALSASQWESWLVQAREEVLHSGGAGGRDNTPAVLGALHRISGGRTLAANIELVKHNTMIAAMLASTT